MFTLIAEIKEPTEVTRLKVSEAGAFLGVVNRVWIGLFHPSRPKLNEKVFPVACLISKYLQYRVVEFLVLYFNGS